MRKGKMQNIFGKLRSFDVYCSVCEEKRELREIIIAAAQVLKGKRGRGRESKYRVSSIDRQLVVAVVAIMSPPLSSLSSGKEKEEEEEGY